MQLAAEDKLLLSVVKLHPSAVELDKINALIPQIKDWTGFTNNIIAHGSAPLLFKKLSLLNNNSFIPADVKTKLKHTYYKTLTRSILLYQAFAELIQALQADDVQPTILKGAHLSEILYGDIALRQFSDIDILVPVNEGEKSLEVLSKLGYKPREMHPISDFVAKNSDFVHYPPMEKGEISVEVHIKLHTRSAHYQLSIPDILSRTNNEIINKQKVKVLSIEDLLMHLCIHADKHFTKGAIQLKSFNDIVNLLEQLKTGFNWERFERMCQQYKCEEVVFKYFVLLAKYYQAYLPAHYLKHYSYCLSPAFEAQFVGYLHGESYEQASTSAVPGHIDSLRNIKNPWYFVVYMKEVLFPSKAFMIEKYGLKSKVKRQRKVVYSEQFAVNSAKKMDFKRNTENWKLRYWWLWYPYRWWVGVKELVKLVVDSLK